MNSETQPMVVYLVDDDADVRASLRMLLESVGIQVQSYPDADRFLKDYQGDQSGQPSCLLLDVRMPGLSGMALLEKLHQESVHLPVIILTGHGDIPMSVQAMKLGAVDFLTKPLNPQKLLDLVQSVLRDHRLQGAEPSSGIDPRDAMIRWENLTPREREIFKYIVKGLANKTIAIELGISTRTVETHRAHIMEKMRARTLVDLVMLGLAIQKHP
jgi:FixJ family two-component response regulator